MAKDFFDGITEWLEPMLRWFQALTSMSAMAFVIASFSVIQWTYNGGDSKLNQSLATPTTNFILLLTYSSMMYSLWSAVIMHGYELVEPMTAKTSMIIDGAFSVAYLAGTIAFLCLPLHKDCSALVTNGFFIHCDHMTISIVFCWFTFVLFFVTLCWKGWTTVHSTKPNDTTTRNVGETLQDTEPVYAGRAD